MSIEESDYIDAEISLQPNSIHVRSMQYFDNLGVCKDFVQNLEFSSPRLKSVNNPILVPGTDLHKRNDTDIRMNVVMFQIYCYFSGLLQLFEHLFDAFKIVYESGRRLFKRVIWYRLGIRINSSGILIGIDLILIRVLKPTAVSIQLWLS